MRKYLQISKINFLNNITYVVEFLMKALFIILILFIFANLWKTIYSGRELIEGFSVAMMVWYLVVTESIVTSVSSIIDEVNQEVQSGDIAYKLNKPYNYIFYHLAKSISYQIIGFSLTFVLGAIVVYLLVGGFTFNYWTIPIILIVLLLAFVLNFFMLMCIALLAFWFEDTESLRWIYDKIIFTIGGMLVPLEIFPQWLAKISAALPFSFVAYYPAKLFVNFNSISFLNVICVQIIYILIFMAIAFIIYRIGSRRLNINGG